MTNAELKEKILNEFLDAEEVIVLEGDEFADGAIGLTEDKRLVYSYDKLVRSLSKVMEGDEEDREVQAIEFLDYNTIPSLAYMGAHAPVIMHEIR